MKTTQHILLLFLSFFILHCGSGTKVGNPNPSQMVPEFESNIAESGLGYDLDNAEEDTTSSPGLLWSRAGLSVLVTAAENWNDLVPEGPYFRNFNHRRNIRNFLDKIQEEIDNQEIEASSNTQSFDLSSQTLLGLTQEWTITIQIFSSNTDYIEVTMSNKESGNIDAYFLYSEGSDGLPQKGIFVFQNKDALSDDAGSEEPTQFLGLAFDFSASPRKLITRTIYFSSTHNTYTIDHIHHQCDPQTTACLSEFYAIIDDDSRDLADNRFRMKYNNTTEEVCFAAVSRDAIEQTTEFFVGSPTSVEEGSCTIDDSIWVDNMESISAVHLPIRFQDSPTLATAVRYFENNLASLASFIQPEFIDDWLTATEFDENR